MRADCRRRATIPQHTPLLRRVMRKGTHPGLRPPLRGGDVCCSPPWACDAYYITRRPSGRLAFPLSPGGSGGPPGQECGLPARKRPGGKSKKRAPRPGGEGLCITRPKGGAFLSPPLCAALVAGWVIPGPVAPTSGERWFLRMGSTHPERGVAEQRWVPTRLQVPWFDLAPHL